MFEHLTPKTKNYSSAKKRRQVNYKFYAGFFVLALFLLILSWGFSQGSPSAAVDQGSYSPAAQVYSLANTAEEIVAQTPKLSVFNFVISTDQPFTLLQQIKISVKGVYHEEWLADLHLYHQGTQLGQITDVGEGVLYVEPGNFILNEGDNYFQLRLTRSDNLTLADAASFSLVQPADVVLSYQDHIFVPRGDFPITSHSVQVIERGSLLVYNMLTNKVFAYAGEQNGRLAVFGLSATGETVSLRQLQIDYDAQIDLSGQKFYLAAAGQIIAQTQAEEGRLTFQFTQAPVVKNSQDLSLELWSALPSDNEYGFTLAEIIGQGFISGDEIKISDPLALSTVTTLAAAPYFEAANQATKLSDGWNNLFSLKVTPTTASISLDKLTWEIKQHGTQITDLELWADGAFYSANLSLQDNMIVADFSSAPLEISRARQIDLLVKVTKLAEQTRLQANLLGDQDSDLDLSANLLWSAGEQQYNGYLLPNLPLVPVVLSN